MSVDRDDDNGGTGDPSEHHQQPTAAESVRQDDPGGSDRPVSLPPNRRSDAPGTYVVTIQHPAHVHFFRHAIAELSAAGHEVYVFVRRNEVAVELLERYAIDHTVLAGEASGLASLAVTQATYELRLLRAIRGLDPDVIAGIGGVAAAHVSTVLDARGIVFTDTEHATIVNTLASPFADVVCTPDCFETNLGTRHVRYPAYHELAYLHPDRFDPDPTVLEEIHGNPGDPIVVLRIGAWDSSHDVGQGGFADIRDVVDRLEDAGARPVITSEVSLPPSMENYRLSLDPHRVHDLLYYADCYLGEGATMAAESAVLGTPAIYVNSLSMGYTSELESEFGLLSQFDGNRRHERAIARAKTVLANDGDDPWACRREQLVREKVDTTTVILDVLTGLEDPSWASEPIDST